MSLTNLEPVLHNIRVKLYPSSLPRSNGGYSARTANEAELSIEDVAATLVSRGGFTGNYHDLVTHVKEFMDEAAYQLCDGYAVNTGYFSIHPAVAGYFASRHEDPRGHRIRFRFRARKRLRELARYITIEVEQETGAGRLDAFTDYDTGETNGHVTPGGIFTVQGMKIKVTGGHPDSGVYFVPEAGPAQRIKVTRKLVINTRTRVSGFTPPLPAGEYRIMIMTQFTIGGIDLKEPRTLTGAFTVRSP